jgi:GNAT superfamily N-acetyltransferase
VYLGKIIIKWMVKKNIKLNYLNYRKYQLFLAVKKMIREILIRNGKVNDKHHVAKIWQEIMEYHREISSINLEVRQDAPKIFMEFYENNVRSINKKALIAEEDGIIIGYMMGAIQKRPPVFKNRNQAFITDAAVTANKRNSGIGEQLLIAFEDWVKEKKLNYIVLNVVPENTVGINFWQKHGFQTIVLNQQKMVTK